MVQIRQTKDYLILRRKGALQCPNQIGLRKPRLNNVGHASRWGRLNSEIEMNRRQLILHVTVMKIGADPDDLYPTARFVTQSPEEPLSNRIRIRKELARQPLIFSALQK
jgi:hypothetical protein